MPRARCERTCPIHSVEDANGWIDQRPAMAAGGCHRSRRRASPGFVVVRVAKAAQEGRPSVSLKASPSNGFVPLRVVVTAELQGRLEDDERPARANTCEQMCGPLYSLLPVNPAFISTPAATSPSNQEAAQSPRSSVPET